MKDSHPLHKKDIDTIKELATSIFFSLNDKDIFSKKENVLDLALKSGDLNTLLLYYYNHFDD